MKYIHCYQRYIFPSCVRFTSHIFIKKSHRTAPPFNSSGPHASSHSLPNLLPALVWLVVWLALQMLSILSMSKSYSNIDKILFKYRKTNMIFPANVQTFEVKRSVQKTKQMNNEMKTRGTECPHQGQDKRCPSHDTEVYATAQNSPREWTFSKSVEYYRNKHCLSFTSRRNQHTSFPSDTNK